MKSLLSNELDFSSKKSETMEVWKDIPNYEGLYQASSMGNIRTVGGKTTYTNYHSERVWKSRIMGTRGKSPSGYRVSLWKDGKVTEWLVHRLVALTFLGEPPTPKYTVNHKDGNRFNNRVENLEWLTIGDNIRYGFEHGQYPTQIKVTLVGENGQKEFRSMAEGDRFLGRNVGYISNRNKKGKPITSKDGDVYVAYF